MNGTFERLSLAAFAEKIGIPQGWFVISHHWIEGKKERRKQHGRWFKITSSEGSVYRVLRFSPNLKFSQSGSGQIVLDYAAWLDLSGRVEETPDTIKLTLTPARLWQYPRLAISHPDPAIRIAGWISIVSLILGAISVALGIWALCLTYSGGQ